jgi:hypothetical protein
MRSSSILLISIIQVTRSRGMGWVGDVERSGVRAAAGYWWENFREREHFEDLT